MAVRVEGAELIEKLGVGRISWRFVALVILLSAVVVLGAYAYSRQLVEGDIVTGMRDWGTMGGAPWGLYVAFYVYFVGVSFAGITVAALIRLMHLTYLRPIARMAELLTITSLLVGAMAIIADLGQPLRGIVNLFLYARPQSPFFGTFTLVVVAYLFASLVYLYLDGRRDAAICARLPGRLQWFYRLWAAGYRDTPAERERHRRASFWLALAIVPLLITAHSTLGFVFGLQVGRPGWFSALQAPGFVIMAGVSGIGLLIVIAAAVRRAFRLEEELPLKIFAWLANFLWVLVATYLYFMIVELLTATYTAHHHERRLMIALLVGEYAWIFWLSVGLLVGAFLLLFVQFLRGRYHLPLIVLAGFLVNLPAIGKRYLIVVPSLTHGGLLPYGTGTYAPTWVEYAVVLGLFGLGALLYVLFMKVFPILHLPEGGGER